MQGKKKKQKKPKTENGYQTETRAQEREEIETIFFRIINREYRWKWEICWFGEEKQKTED